MGCDRGYLSEGRGAPFGTQAEVLVRGVVTLALAGTIPAAASAQRAASANAQQPATAASLVFDGVTVVDVEHGERLPAQRVVVTGNRIRAVGAAGAVEVPKGAQVVEARGKYLIPGLWDMHVHTAGSLAQRLLVANGVIGVRDAWAFVPLDTMIRWRREILDGTRVGPPRQILSGVAISTDLAWEHGPCELHINGWSGHVCVPSADSSVARRLIDSLKAAGADMVKVYDLTAEMFFVVAAEARRVHLPVGGHHHDDKRLTMLEASDSGARIMDHVMAFGGLSANICLNGTVARCGPVAERFRRNNTWWVPTLSATGPAPPDVVQRSRARARAYWSGRLQADVDRDTVGPRDVPNLPYEWTADSPHYLDVVRNVGLPILAGTDVDVGPGMPERVPGFELHTELEAYVAAGLTPLEALQTATLNPAKMLGATDSLGTVAPDKLADVVLLDADPLTDIANTRTIRAVVANGRYFDRAALDQMLNDVRAEEIRIHRLVGKPYDGDGNNP